MQRLCFALALALAALLLVVGLAAGQEREIVPWPPASLVPAPALSSAGVFRPAQSPVLPECPGGYEVKMLPGGGLVYTCASMWRKTKIDMAITGSLWVLGGLYMGDVATTVLALDRGATEQNPMLKTFQKYPVQTAMAKGAINMASALAIDRLRDRGKKKLALTCAIAQVGLYGWVVINNMKVLEQQRTAGRR